MAPRVITKVSRIFRYISDDVKNCIYLCRRAIGVPCKSEHAEDCRLCDAACEPHTPVQAECLLCYAAFIPHDPVLPDDDWDAKTLGSKTSGNYDYMRRTRSTLKYSSFMDGVQRKGGGVGYYERDPQIQLGGSFVRSTSSKPLITKY